MVNSSEESSGYVVDSATVKNQKGAATTDNTVLTRIEQLKANHSIIFDFDNVASLSRSNLPTGTTAITKGYYKPNDGGASKYKIRSKEIGEAEDNGSIIFLNNNNVAELMVEDYLNVKQFGVMPSDTTSDALSKINAILALNKFPKIMIPADINYGYSNSVNGRTLVNPDIYSCSIRTVIWDCSIDNSYANDNALNPNKGKNALQVRIWCNTPDGADGQHDGGVIKLCGLYNPTLMLSNDSADINARRASIMFATRQKVNWKVGQGITNNDENFVIGVFGSHPAGAVMSIDYNTHNISFGSGSTPYSFGVFRPITVINDTETFLAYKNKHSNPTYIVKLKDGSSGVSIETLQGGEIFKLANDGSALDLYAKGDATETKILLHGPGHSIGRIATTGSELCLIYNGTTVLKTDSSNAVVCKAGVSGGSGTTAERPSAVTVGTMFFDITLGKPIWYKGSNVWVDANGDAV